MNRPLWKPALLTLTLLAVAGASGVVLLGSSGPDKKKSSPGDDVAKANNPVPKVGETPRPGPKPGAGEGTKVEEAAGVAARPKTGEGPKAPEAPKVAPDPKAAELARVREERRQLLETLGTLTAANCYQTYLNIGLLADSKAKGTYSDKDAYKVLDSVLALLDSVDRKLAALSKLDLDKEDRDTLDQMRMLSDLLHQQGKQLEAFWDTGKDEDATKYENARKDSWAVLSKLLRISQ